MERLYVFQEQLIRATTFLFRRDFIDKIEWDERLIGLIGARGVGKTTLILQHLTENTESKEETLYITIDNLAMPIESLFTFAEGFYKSGGKRLYIDEIHKFPNWAIELKNIYDLIPGLKVVFSGSSILKILDDKTDLSRRAVIYSIPGLSFREFLQIKLSIELPVYNLEEILNNHETIASSLVRSFQPLALYNQYMKFGHYPYFLQSESTYGIKLNSTINYVLENEISTFLRADLRTIQKLKRLLYIIAASVPFQPNISKLAHALELNRTTLLSYLSLLDTAEIIHSLFNSGSFYGKLSKPGKILLLHPNLAFCMNPQNMNQGSLREAFIVNQLKYNHKVELSNAADFLIDEKITFEIGGKGKTRRQIKNVPESYIIADDLETGSKNKIP
ncbi:MAG TPA: AAA family ATPase, partial [Mariniphaga anaerophila]|nr:AAA family ATPase [Mariniphaga anaerophila]